MNFTIISNWVNFSHSNGCVITNYTFYENLSQGSARFCTTKLVKVSFWYEIFNSSLFCIVLITCWAKKEEKVHKFPFEHNLWLLDLKLWVKTTFKLLYFYAIIIIIIFLCVCTTFLFISIYEKVLMKSGLTDCRFFLLSMKFMIREKYNWWHYAVEWKHFVVCFRITSSFSYCSNFVGLFCWLFHI